jgi:anti-sigma regulatory factor (Ser/Thr protein kinase)
VPISVLIRRDAGEALGDNRAVADDAATPRAGRPSSAQLLVPPELSSAPATRRFVASTLDDWGLGDLVEDAVLCTDELVCNAILHARTDVEVEIRRVGAGVRVDVKDHERLPVPVAAPGRERAGAGPDDWEQLLELEAMTGRGLVLVDAISERWGSETEPGGKRVWFELGTEGEERTAADRGEGDRAGDALPVGLEAVVLHDIPLRLALYNDEHLDDLVREFQLMSLDPAVAAHRPAELAGLIEEILASYAAPRHGARDRTRELLAAGHQRGDITMLLPPEAASDIQRLHALVLEADRFCRQGHLLSLAASDQVMALREWIVSEVVHQLGGGLPAPCPIEG